MTNAHEPSAMIYDTNARRRRAVSITAIKSIRLLIRCFLYAQQSITFDRESSAVHTFPSVLEIFKRIIIAVFVEDTVETTGRA